MENTSKSLIKIDAKELDIDFNLKSLLNLLEQNNVYIENVISTDFRTDSEQKITNTYIPSELAKIIVHGTYEDILIILQSSDEF